MKRIDIDKALLTIGAFTFVLNVLLIIVQVSLPSSRSAVMATGIDNATRFIDSSPAQMAATVRAMMSPPSSVATARALEQSARSFMLASRVTSATATVIPTVTPNVLPTSASTPSVMALKTNTPPIATPTATRKIFSTLTPTNSPINTSQPLIKPPLDGVRVSIPNTHYVNARAEPSERSAVLAILASGTQVVAVARTTNGD